MQMSLNQDPCPSELSQAWNYTALSVCVGEFLLSLVIRTSIRLARAVT